MGKRSCPTNISESCLLPYTVSIISCISETLTPHRAVGVRWMLTWEFLRA